MLARKFITIDHFSISYAEKNASSPQVIFFFHGNSNSADLWHNQFSDSSFDNYRLIAVDLPAHGKTGMPREQKDCSITWFAEIFSKCISELAAEQPYILCGLSLGGNVIAEMLAFSTKPAGLVFVSSNLVGNGITPKDIISDSLVGEVLFTDGAPLESIRLYLRKASFSSQDKNRGLLLKDYMAVNSMFREAFPASIVSGLYSDEIRLVREFNKPVLVVFGDGDTVGSADLMNNQIESLWGDQVILIQGSGHLVPLDKPKPLNRLLNIFLNDVF